MWFLQRGNRIRRRLPRPQDIDVQVHRHDPTPTKNQQDKQSLMQQPCGSDVVASGVVHAQRAEHLDPAPVAAPAHVTIGPPHRRLVVVLTSARLLSTGSKAHAS